MKKEHFSNTISNIFGRDPIVIGMIHTRPFPGAPRYKGELLDSIIEYSLNDARILIENGIDGLMFENHGDIPFLKPENIGYETVSMMTRIIDEVKRKFSCPFGINILANAPIAALSIGKATGANWVRCNQWANAYVANEGIVEGKAGEVLRYRSSIDANDICIMSDVHVKHGSHSIVADRAIEELAKDSVFFDADILIATGQRTGDSTSLDEINQIKKGHDLPVLIGSGVSPENLPLLLPHVNGMIVGSTLKKDGAWWNPVDAERTKLFMELVNKIRK